MILKGAKQRATTWAPAAPIDNVQYRADRGAFVVIPGIGLLILSFVDARPIIAAVVNSFMTRSAVLFEYIGYGKGS